MVALAFLRLRRQAGWCRSARVIRLPVALPLGRWHNHTVLSAPVPDFSVKPTLTGQRVVLRPFALGQDAPALRQMLSDPETLRLTGSHATIPRDGTIPPRLNFSILVPAPETSSPTGLIWPSSTRPAASAVGRGRAERMG